MKKEGLEKLKKEPWRILAGVVAVMYIIYMWTEKNVADIYGAMSPEEALPLVITTFAVTLGKVFLMAGGLLIIRWLLGKLRK